MEFYENFIPLRDKIEAGVDLVGTITSQNVTEWLGTRKGVLSLCGLVAMQISVMTALLLKKGITVAVLLVSLKINFHKRSALL